MTSLFVLLKQLVAFMLAIINMFGLKTNTVEVELYANPVSGYTWEYSYDNYGVLTLTDSYYMPDASEILSGGSGTQKYIFRAVGTGTVNVTFPISFPSACYSVTTSGNAILAQFTSTSNATGRGCCVDGGAVLQNSISSSGFTCASERQISWIATGK